MWRNEAVSAGRFVPFPFLPRVRTQSRIRVRSPTSEVPSLTVRPRPSPVLFVN